MAQTQKIFAFEGDIKIVGFDTAIAGLEGLQAVAKQLAKDLGKLDKNLVNVAKSMTDNMKDVSKGASENTKELDKNKKAKDDNTNSSSKLTGSLGGLSAGFGSLTTKLAGTIAKYVSLKKAMEFLKDGIMLNVDLTEATNVMTIAFGENADMVSEWAKGLKDAFGISEVNAITFSGRLRQMFASMGVVNEEADLMALRLTELSGDIASLYNIEVEQAFEKLKSGMVGLPKPLKDLGIAVDDATVKAHAMANGLDTTWESLTQAEKAVWRYNTILTQTENAQGDFSRTSGETANQMRLMKLNMEELAMSLTADLMPIVNALFVQLNEGAKSFKKFFEEGAIGKKIFDGLMSAISFFVPLIEQVIEKVSSLAEDVFPILKDIFDELIPVIKDIISFLVPLLLKQFDSMKKVFFAVAPAIKSVVGLFKSLWTLLKPILSLVGMIASAVMDKLVPAFEYVGNIIKGIADFFKSIIDLVIRNINRLIGIANKIPGINIDKVGLDEDPTATLDLPSAPAQEEIITTIGDDLLERAGAGEGGQIVINIDGDVSEGTLSDLIRELNKEKQSQKLSNLNIVAG